MASIYQLIPKNHRSGKTVFKMYLNEPYRTYFQYSEKRFDGKRYLKKKYIGILTYIKKPSSDYDRLLNDWETQLNRNIYSTPKYLINEIYEEFLRFRRSEMERGEYSTKSFPATRQRLTYFSEWLTKHYGRLELNQLKPVMISDFTEHLKYDKVQSIRKGQKSVDGKKGLANKTIIGYLTSIRTFLTWGNKKSYMDNDVYTDITLKWEWPNPRVRKKDKSLLYPAMNHYEKYVEYLQKKVNKIPYQTHIAGTSPIKPSYSYYVMYIQAVMGMRINEVLELKWKRASGDNEGKSISFSYLDENNNIHIYSKKQKRTIPIPKRVLKVIDKIPRKIGKGHKSIDKHRLENSFTGGFKRQRYKEYPSTYLFENPYNKLPYSVASLWTSLQEILLELKFPPYGFHSWRRGFITKMFVVEPNILLIGDYVGHSSQAITDLYKELHPQHLQSVSKSIDKI